MSAKRKSLSKRTRFDVLKRDGFRCRYCGATPDQRLLQVDHIVPVVDGGTDDIINLVTSCQPCNSGKAHKGLESQPAPMPRTPTARELAEQRKQVEAYLAARKEAEAMRDDVAETFAHLWERSIGPMTEGAFHRLRALTESVDHNIITQGIETTAKSKLATPGAEFDSYTAVRQLKYFNAVVRNIREGREWRKY